MSRKNIPTALRHKIWSNFFYNSMKGQCQCCKCEITITNFQAGHIIAESKGGATNENNLIPICQSCNTSMGQRNLLEYKQTYYNESDNPGELSDNFLCELVKIILTNNTAGNSLEKLLNIRDKLLVQIDKKINEL